MVNNNYHIDNYLENENYTNCKRDVPIIFINIFLLLILNAVILVINESS